MYLNMFLADELNCHLYNWHTLDPYYKGALLNAARSFLDHQKYTDAARAFFSIAFPSYRPKSRPEWIRLLRDRRVEQLRSEVRRAVDETRNIDQEYAQAALRELLDAREAVASFKKFTGWAAIPASILAGLIGTATGGLFSGIVGSIATRLAKEVVDKYKERRGLEKYAWMYFNSNE